MQIKKNKNKSGFSLIELVVSIGIFSFLLLAIVKIFLSLSDSQDRTIAINNLSSDLASAMDTISLDLLRAQKNTDDTCGTCNNKFFCVTSGALYFLNYNKVCSIYSLENDTGSVGRIKLQRASTSNYITNNDLKITSLSFAANSTNNAITVKIEAESGGKTRFKQTAKLQNTIIGRQ